MKCVLVVALAACGSDVTTSTTCDTPRGASVDWFRDVTESSGVDFTYATTDFKGGALVVSDLDGDDLPDIIASSRAGGTSVYRNRGGLRFDARTDTGIPADLAATAAAAVDLDNDGDLDVVLAGRDSALVFANAGDGTFTRATTLEGSGFTEHVLAVDLDNDGALDLYLSNYDSVGGPNAADRVYMQRGALAFTPTTISGNDLSWTASAFDIDGDGDLDIHVANDTLIPDQGEPPVTPPPWPADKLLRNDGIDASGCPILTDIAVDAGLAQPRSSMSSVLGDVDEDGALDLFVTDWGPNKLFTQQRSAFVDRAADLGLTPAARGNDYCARNPTSDECLLFSWSASAADFDGDGHDEILVVNGGNGAGDIAPVQLFSRAESAVFTERAPTIPCGDNRGLVLADLDGDGDDDVVISPRRGPLALYETQGSPTAWLEVRLHGTSSNHDGIGAIVRVMLASGRTLARSIGMSGTIHTASTLTARISLGTDSVTSIEVRWPSGQTSTTAGPVTGRVVLDEP